MHLRGHSETKNDLTFCRWLFTMPMLYSCDMWEFFHDGKYNTTYLDYFNIIYILGNSCYCKLGIRSAGFRNKNKRSLVYEDYQLRLQFNTVGENEKKSESLESRVG